MLQREDWTALSGGSPARPPRWLPAPDSGLAQHPRGSLSAEPWGRPVLRALHLLTLTCPKPMVMAAAEVKPLMTGQEMKSSTIPGGSRGALSQPPRTRPRRTRGDTGRERGVGGAGTPPSLVWRAGRGG